MSSFEFTDGFRLQASTFLSDTTAQFKERRLAWFHDYYNYVLFRYDQTAELLVCICVVDEQWLFNETVDVEMSEWDGTDGLWHDLKIVLNGDDLRTYRDGELIFEYTDSALCDMPKTGYIQLSNTYGATCFDDVELIRIGPAPFVPGDANGSGGVDIDDIVYLIAYVFQGGPAPTPLETGECNCDGGIDIDDIVYLIEYVFQSGPEPGCGK